jgi:hypothetical protein
MAKKDTPIDHKDRAHALLSASGSSRWLTCTPSAQLESVYPNTSSVFADEGTAAHELAELKLRYTFEGEGNEPVLKAKIRGFKAQNPHFNEEMDQHTQTYVDYIYEVHNEAVERDYLAEVFTEVRVDLTKYVPEGFGTVDNAVIGGNVLDIIDLKYGKGVRVSAVDNSQLKLYALGALEAYSILYDIETVRLHIHQPRLDAVSVFELSAAELISWGHIYVMPKAAEAMAGDGKLVTGAHCGFCKAKNRCAALAKEAHEVAALDFADPRILTDAQVLDVYAKADRLTRWLSGLGDYLLGEALEGKAWDGYKLVEGRSNRVLTDKAAAKARLEATDLDPGDYMKSELQGITALEKVLGKKGFEDVLGALIDKPQGKPTLVSADDKRPAFDPVANAANDFK